MSSRGEKDRSKATQDKAQAILATLLKDEDNKYCVDCDAKGPRWASWNLGIFLCIRCAGIHRNLGVHISKVKSVNLDAWTPEQISMMMEIGNSRARAVYEANIPDNFRRPQTDSPLESFIRAKYENKKYIAREWIPPTPKVPKEFLDDESKDKKRSKPKISVIQLNVMPKPKPTQSTTNGEQKKSPDQAKPVQTPESSQSQPGQSSGAIDLLGLDAPSSTTSNTDLLGDLLGGARPVQPTQARNDNPVSQQSQPLPQGQNQSSDPTTTNGTTEELLMSDTQSKSTKESILALYGSASNQQQFNVPGGVYMQQQPAGQQPMGMYGGMMPAMAGMQGNMAQQHPGMQGNMAQQHPGMQGNMAQQHPGMQGNMVHQHPGMQGNMAQQHPSIQGNMAQQQGMMAMQLPADPMYTYQYQMPGQYYDYMYMPYEQQPNMYNLVGMPAQQMMMQPGMMGGNMGNVGGYMGNTSGYVGNNMGNMGGNMNAGGAGNMGGYNNQPQIQQYQQMQNQMSAMKLGNTSSVGMGIGNVSQQGHTGVAGWGNSSTLSTNLWQ